MDAVEQIAAAVLYEGYLLWPYRRSAQKNQRRWTFGALYPSGGDEPCLLQSQCLVVGERPRLDVRVRFLQHVERRVARRAPPGGLDFVDELRIGGERYLAWQEAVEREVRLEAPGQLAIELPAGTSEEALPGEAGAIVRSWEAIRGAVEVTIEPLRPGLFRLAARVTNSTSWTGGDRAAAAARALLSTHLIFSVDGGELVSMTDPPDALKEDVAACVNIGTWPVLVDRRTMLSSPIILPDYPRVAPESPGDLFDGTEIDQMLVLNILSLTAEEKDELRATDPRARAILERSEALTPEELMRLHGAIRDEMTSEPSPPESVYVGGVAISRGSRVRLRPKAGGDVFDLVLVGKVAVVEAIEQDYDERIHVAVTLEDDPGRDLGIARQPGHRFFFSPEEVEPL